MADEPAWTGGTWDRGSPAWNEYAALLVGDTVQGLMETRELFRAYLAEKLGDPEEYRAVADTKMKLACLDEALAERGAI